jgi:outer membrane autotransporter protein
MGIEIRRRRGVALMAVSFSAAALMPALSLADVYTLASGNTEATPRSVTGTDTLSIEAGAVLDTEDTAIEWIGASPDAGVTITNGGSIVSRDRGIDTDGDDSERSLTLHNAAGAVIETGDDAFRVDTDVSEGDITVNNSGTLRSAGGQVLDFDSIESPTAVVTITNAESGLIEADDNDAIRPGVGMITIDNAGRILSTASANRAVNVADFAHLSEFHLTNESTGIIESIDDAVRIDGDDDQQGAKGVVTLDNYGLILSSGIGDDAGQAIDFDHIESGQADVTINNYAGGEIRAEDADAVRPGEGATVNNTGTIVSNSSEPDASNDGVDLQGHAATVNNLAGGTISGARHGITTDVDVTVYNAAGAAIRGRNGSGVGSDGDGKVVNEGLISGDIDTDSQLGDGDGVDIDYIGDITNGGTIRGTGAKGQKPGDTPNQSEGIAMGGGSIVNTDESALISGADNGILIDDGSSGGAYGETTIINRGTIEGVDGYGISLVGDFDDTVVNSGLIAGGNGLALAFGDGDDTLIVETGGTFDGRIDGEDGVDSIVLDGDGEFAGGDNFESLSINGDWRLTGTQQYADGIDLSSGSRLDLDGTLDGALAVAADGLLEGNGTLGDVTMDGTISPGHSVGQLNVAGDYQQTAGSTYQAEIDGAGSADRIRVDGMAALAGDLVVTPLSDDAYASSSYTLLTAAEGVSGGYTDPEAYSPFFDLDLDYQANAVVLEVTRNDTRFADLAASDNQRATAAGLESLGAGNGLYDAIISTTDTAKLRHDYDALSGEIHASARTGLIEESRFVREAVFDRMRGAESASPRVAIATGAASATKGLSNDRSGVWLQGFGGWGESDGDDNAAGLERSTHGLFVGVDTLVGAADDSAWRVGLAGGYSRSDYDVDRRDSSADIDSYTLAAYAGRSFGPLGLRLGAAQSWHDLDTRRSIDVADFDTAKASYDARTAQVFGEIGISLTAGRTRLEPYVGLAYVDLHSDGYQESGEAGLHGQDGDADVTFSTLGLRATTPFEIGSVNAGWQAAVGWQHAFGDRTPTADQAFRGGHTFSVDAVPVGEDAVTLATGIDMALSPATSVGVGYTGRLASDARDQSVDANLKIRF